MLLDTCVVSELWKPRPNPDVFAFINAANLDEAFLSVVTIGELAKGVALLPNGRKKATLTQWVMQLERHYEDRLLGVDRDTAQIWGELTARLQSEGVQLPAIDALIAATALRHGLRLVTRNTRHFQTTGAILINPWGESGRLP